MLICSSKACCGISIYFTVRKFENIYIGWGLKYSALSFNPTLPLAKQIEFPMGADIKETVDPTVEQEQALKASQEEEAAHEDEEESDEGSESEGD